MFVTRVMLGILPTGEKATVRQLNDGRCLGCHNTKETIKHLFLGVPCTQEPDLASMFMVS